MQPLIGDGPTQIEVEHAGLDPGHALLGIDLEDDDQRIADRRGTTREAGATPAGDERPVVTRRDAHGVGDLPVVAREAHRRSVTGGDSRVARVQRELERLRAGPVRSECGAEIGEQRVGVDSLEINESGRGGDRHASVRVPRRDTLKQYDGPGPGSGGAHGWFARQGNGSASTTPWRTAGSGRST